MSACGSGIKARSAFFFIRKSASALPVPRRRSRREPVPASCRRRSQIECAGLVATNNAYRFRPRAFQLHRKTRRPREIPAAGDREHNGHLRTRLNASGDTISTGRHPRCSCPRVGSSPTSQISPRFIRSTHCRQVRRRAIRGLPCCAPPSRCIGPGARRAVARPLLRLHDQPPPLHGQSYFAPARKCKMSSRRGTASMTSPRPYADLLCAYPLPKVILQYNLSPRGFQLLIV